MNKLQTYFSQLTKSTFDEADVNSFSHELESSDFIYYALKKILDTNNPNAIMEWVPGTFGPSSMRRKSMCLNIILQSGADSELIGLLFEAGVDDPNIYHCNDETIKILLNAGLIMQDDLCKFINKYPGECNGLLSYVQDLNQVRDVLVAACGSGNVDIVKKFIDLGIDFNFISRWGQSPLSAAIRVISDCCGHGEDCHDDIAQMLIEAGADPNFNDIYDKAAVSKYIVNLQKKEDLLGLAQQINYQFTHTDYASMYQEFKNHLRDL